MKMKKNIIVVLTIFVYNICFGGSFFGTRDNTKVKKSGDIMTGKLTTPQIEVSTISVVKTLEVIDSTFVVKDGKVGLGTTAPYRNLHINGIGMAGVRISNTALPGNSFLELYTSDGGQTLFQNSGGRTRISIVGNEVMTFLNNGNIGINTTLPLSKFDINGETIIRSSCTIQNTLFVSTISLGNYLEIKDKLRLGDLDAYGRRRLWYYDTNSVLKLGGAISDGDGINADSEGIVVIHPTSDSMARIKADRIGLTRSSDSSYYYFRADKNALFYKSTDTTKTRLYINNTSGNVGIGTNNPASTLDVDGDILAIQTRSNIIYTDLIKPKNYDSVEISTGIKARGYIESDSWIKASSMSLTGNLSLSQIIGTGGHLNWLNLYDNLNMNNGLITNVNNIYTKSVEAETSVKTNKITTYSGDTIDFSYNNFNNVGWVKASSMSLTGDISVSTIVASGDIKAGGNIEGNNINVSNDIIAGNNIIGTSIQGKYIGSFLKINYINGLTEPYVRNINVSTITFTDGTILTSTKTLGGGSGGSLFETTIKTIMQNLLVSDSEKNRDLNRNKFFVPGSVYNFIQLRNDNQIELLDGGYDIAGGDNVYLYPINRIYNDVSRYVLIESYSNIDNVNNFIDGNETTYAQKSSEENAEVIFTLLGISCEKIEIVNFNMTISLYYWNVDDEIWVKIGDYTGTTTIDPKTPYGYLDRFRITIENSDTGNIGAEIKFYSVSSNNIITDITNIIISSSVNVNNFNYTRDRNQFTLATPTTAQFDRLNVNSIESGGEIYSPENTYDNDYNTYAETYSNGYIIYYLSSYCNHIKLYMHSNNDMGNVSFQRWNEDIWDWETFYTIYTEGGGTYEFNCPSLNRIRVYFEEQGADSLKCSEIEFYKYNLPETYIDYEVNDQCNRIVFIKPSKLQIYKWNGTDWEFVKENYETNATRFISDVEPSIKYRIKFTGIRADNSLLSEIYFDKITISTEIPHCDLIINTYDLTLDYDVNKFYGLFSAENTQNSLFYFSVDNGTTWNKIRAGEIQDITNPSKMKFRVILQGDVKLYKIGGICFRL